MIGARFDDVVSGASFVFGDPVAEIIARDTSEVVDAVTAASEAAASGKWVAGYVTYEGATAFDDALVTHDAEPGLPLAWFGVFATRSDTDLALTDPMCTGTYALSRWTPAMKRGEYDAAFAAVRAHIADGDSYQVNLTFPLHAAFGGSADCLYRDLVSAQRPGYAVHLQHGARHVISVSPELFFSISGRTIRSRPMKGTMRRGRYRDEDDVAADILASSEKDKAENLMIVDLIRNDIGRVAVTGTVEVPDLFRVQRFPTVWQMTSTVEAQLTADTALSDVFAALFPCGSVTGAPKAASMRIIRDLEKAPRGVYCGAVGFIPPGDGLSGASFNVAIRTVTVDADEGVATYGVGGGITWGSDVHGEYDEAVAKSDVLRFDVSNLDLVETMRWDDGFVHLERHLERLAASADYWSYPDVRDKAAEVLGSLEPALRGPTRVRLAVRDDGTVTVTAGAAPTIWAEGPGPGTATVEVAIDDEPIDERNPRMFHKTSDRRVYDDRRRRHPEAEDVLLVNHAGHVTESTIANVAFLIDGHWWTPPTSDGLVAGILRGVLLERGTIRERSISVRDAVDADAVALISALRGWRAAVVTSVGAPDTPTGVADTGGTTSGG